MEGTVLKVQKLLLLLLVLVYNENKISKVPHPITLKKILKNAKAVERLFHGVPTPHKHDIITNLAQLVNSRKQTKNR